MKKPSKAGFQARLASVKASFRTRSFRVGGYSVFAVLIVAAIAVAANVLAGALPGGWTQYDLTATQLFTLSDQTTRLVQDLDTGVEIYWVVQSGGEDDTLGTLLDRYDGLSDQLTVTKVDPDVSPTFVQQYVGDGTLTNNSLIVVCGERSTYVSYNDIYVQSADMYSYSYTTDFDGEGAITSAIDYVVTEDLPQLYVLEGHGEAELPSTFADQIEKDNIETNTLSLLTVDAIPEEADCILIYAPSSDISTEERDMLADYVSGGGKLLVMAGPVEDGILENLYSLLSGYGVEAHEGIVVEADREHYAFQAPYVLLPDMASHDITDSLIEENYFPILPISLGLTVTGEGSGGTVTELLTTSDAAFSKAAGYDLSTYEKEEGDIDGPFAVAVSVEDDGGGQMVWFTSSVFLEDVYNAYSSGSNGDLAMNALSDLIGEREAMAIRSKSLNYNYLTISASTSALLQTVMIGVCPLLFLGVGIAVILRRRRNQNEPC